MILLPIAFWLQTPNPDLQLIWEVFSTDLPNIRHEIFETNLKESWYLIYKYIGASWICGIILGYVVSVVYSIFSKKTPWEKALYIGEKKCFTILDILTKEGLLYRGLYHSRFPKGALEGSISHINLVFVSRKIMETSHPSDELNTKKSPLIMPAGTYENDSTDIANRDFTDIYSYAFFDELCDMIYPDIRRLSMMFTGIAEFDREKAVNRILNGFWSDSVLLENYLKRKIKIEPDFSISMVDIININFRVFSLKNK